MSVSFLLLTTPRPRTRAAGDAISDLLNPVLSGIAGSGSLNPTIDRLGHAVASEIISSPQTVRSIGQAAGEGLVTAGRPYLLGGLALLGVGVIAGVYAAVR